MTLWILLTGLVAVAAAWLTIPLVRRHEARVDARAATIAVLKDQLADVDVQLAVGTIPAGDAEGLRIEIRRRMLAAGHIAGEVDRTLGQKALSGVALGLAGLVALAAGALYMTMGRPELAQSQPAGSAAAPPAAAAPQADPEVTQLVAGLEKRMAETPDDAQGWQMLAWSYYQTGRFDDAARAYGKAAALRPDAPGLQSAYGEALVQAANGNVTPAAGTAFAKAVAQDGSDARARYFLGVKLAQEGDRRGAIELWFKLLADSPADAPWVPQLRQAITEAGGQAGIDVAARLASTRPGGSASVPGLPAVAAAAAAAQAAPGPSPDQVAAAQGMTPEAQQQMVRGMVERLATRLRDNPRDEEGWIRLMRARLVLGDKPAAAAARDQALKAFAGDAAAQARLRAAAGQMGISG